MTIIFLHGGPGYKNYLSPFFTALENDFNCIYYDQQQGANVLVDDQIMQLDSIVEKLKSRPIILGHSWGGVLATEYALRYQSKIKGLILISTGLSAKQWVQYRNELEENGLKNISMQDLFLAPSELEKGNDLFQKALPTFSEETFNSIFNSYLVNYNLLDHLDKINFPILNIFGENDLRFSLNVTKTFNKYNNKVQDVQIDGAGHFPFLLEENQNTINAHINNYSSQL